MRYIWYKSNTRKKKNDVSIIYINVIQFFFFLNLWGALIKFYGQIDILYTKIQEGDG